jgi:hypothetical protein
LEEYGHSFHRDCRKDHLSSGEECPIGHGGGKIDYAFDRFDQKGLDPDGHDREGRDRTGLDRGGLRPLRLRS